MGTLFRDMAAALITGWLVVVAVPTAVLAQTQMPGPAPIPAPLQSPVPGILAAVPFTRLSDRDISPAGQRALAIHPEQWMHGETPHFEIHFIHNFIAAPVSVEAEFYFRYVTADLRLALAEDGRKCHLYIFESGEDWELFVRSVRLEKWTGAVTIGNELFVPRNPKYKFKGHALGHEIAHLVVHRFLGTRLPLWMEEGYAEDVSLRGYSAFYRARGYHARPRSLPVEGYIPLSSLTRLVSYPPEPQVELFYRESRRLAGFLNAFEQKPQFVKLLGAMAGGEPFDTALHEAYGSRWFSVDDLEAEFKKQLDPP